MISLIRCLCSPTLPIIFICQELNVLPEQKFKIFVYFGKFRKLAVNPLPNKIKKSFFFSYLIFLMIQDCIIWDLFLSQYILCTSSHTQKYFLNKNICIQFLFNSMNNSILKNEFLSLSYFIALTSSFNKINKRAL